MDPYKILGVSKNYTAEELRQKYKSVALQCHPDKIGGNDHLFKMVTASYKLLAKELEKRKVDKQFHELKHDFKSAEPVRMSQAPAEENFNIDKFNRVFNETKIESYTDVGYDDFLKKSIKEQPKLDKSKYTQESFNEKFESEVKPAKSKHLVKYKEPEALMLASKIQYTELGVDNLDDFSGDNMTRKSLNYMDLKVAHTTNRIVDPKSVKKRVEYNSIEALESERAAVRYQMNDREQNAYQKTKQKQEDLQRQREETQRKLDMLTKTQFDKANQLFLGRH